MSTTKLRRCRVCRCVDARACPGGCSWVSANLCSSCKAEDDIVAAFRARPRGKYSIGDWLGLLMPEGSWPHMDDEALANAIAGAAHRKRR